MHIEGSSLIYLIIFIITSIVSAVYFVTKVESSNKANKEFFTATVSHLKESMQLSEKNGKENISQEISHLKEFFDCKLCDVKEDIGRLERKQEESNKVKERIVVLEQSSKSFHKRQDNYERIIKMREHPRDYDQDSA